MKSRLLLVAFFSLVLCVLSLVTGQQQFLQQGGFVEEEQEVKTNTKIHRSVLDYVKQATKKIEKKPVNKEKTAEVVKQGESELFPATRIHHG